MDVLQTDFSELANASRIIIAYSGGVDSSVLLHALATQWPAVDRLLAVHINHGLQAQANHWQQHCQQVCQALAVNYRAMTVDVNVKANSSVEAAARQARYQALQSVMQTGDVVVTAHHRDDQAETLLLQLMRGAGVKGLAAMPKRKMFGRGELVRPLLQTPRAAIMSYAKQQKLTWIDDGSNSNLRFDRNFIRHTIMPSLQQRWPAVQNNLVRSAQHCAQADQLLTDFAEQALGDMVIDFAPDSMEALLIKGGAIDIKALQNHANYYQQHLLRLWLQRLGFCLPSQQQLQQIIEQVIAAKPTANPLTSWANVQVRRYQQRLYAMHPLLPMQSCYAWQDINQALVLPNFTLSAEYFSAVKEKIQSGTISIRFRQTGQRFHPQNRAHSQRVKKLLQEWQIPAFLRDYVPLLFRNEQCIMIGKQIIQ